MNKKQTPPKPFWDESPVPGSTYGAEITSYRMDAAPDHVKGSRNFDTAESLEADYVASDETGETTIWYTDEKVVGVKFEKLNDLTYLIGQIDTRCNGMGTLPSLMRAWLTQVILDGVAELGKE